MSAGLAPTPTPRPAATVVLCRERFTDGAIEVLLLRRHDNLPFMGGAHVFPGGRVEDSDDRTEASTQAPDAAARVQRELAHAAPSRIDRQYRIAAIRELIEEAGVLLARGARGAADVASAQRVRAALADGTGFFDALAAEDLRADVGALVPVAHWVTPAGERRRYDTRFYLAEMPEGQHAAHDGVEATAAAWMRPVDAVAQAYAGTLRLPPPTWITLDALSAHDSLASLRTWAASRTVPRVEPRVLTVQGRAVTVLPGDPEWPVPPDAERPRHTRFRLTDDGWWQPAPVD